MTDAERERRERAARRARVVLENLSPGAEFDALVQAYESEEELLAFAPLHELVRRRPGLTARELAHVRGDPYNSLETRLCRLRRLGRVRSEGKTATNAPARWYVVD